MGKAQRLPSVSPEQDETPAHRSGVDVPPDWFVDPADPAAAEKLQHGSALDDQATAFLAAAEADESDSTVTALTEVLPAAPNPMTAVTTPTPSGSDCPPSFPQRRLRGSCLAGRRAVRPDRPGGILPGEGRLHPGR